MSNYAMKKFAAPIFALSLVSCATDLQPKTALDLSSLDTIPQNGFVAVSVDSDDGFYGLNFAKIDPMTCHVTDTVSFNERTYKRGVKGDTHIVDSFEPGVWVVGGTTFVDGKEKTITKFEGYALAFRVEPGEFIHVGKLLLSVGESTIEAPEAESLAHYVELNTDITMQATPVSPWLTPYSHNTNYPVPGCNPLPQGHV